MEYRQNIKNSNNLLNLIECKKKLHAKNIIGKGKSGSIYKLESEKCGGSVLKIYHKKTSDKEIYREINILDRVKKIIDNDICPHFLYYYDFFKTTNGCADNGTTINILMEYADGDLEKWVKINHSELEWQVMIFQFMIGVHVIQKYLKGFHSNLKPKNIFFIKIKSNPNEYFEYLINTDKYYLPNIGYLFILADYGLFQSSFFDDNTMTDEDITSSIRDNRDFDYIKDFTRKIQINNLSKKYTIDELNKKFNLDNQFSDINKILNYCLEENLLDYNKEKSGFEEQFAPSNELFIKTVLSENNDIEILFKKYFNDFKINKGTIIKTFNLNKI